MSFNHAHSIVHSVVGCSYHVSHYLLTKIKKLELKIEGEVTDMNMIYFIST
jgi:hypothetical protein